MEIEKVIELKEYEGRKKLKNNSKIYLSGIDKGLELKNHDEVKLFLEGLQIGLALSNKNSIIDNI